MTEDNERLAKVIQEGEWLLEGTDHPEDQAVVEALLEIARELQSLRAPRAEGEAAEAALPMGRTKQDVANLVDLALADSLVDLGNGDGGRYDYDILVEKLRGNRLAIVALSCPAPQPATSGNIAPR
jgi:hypothetical protein